jgi:hypothetical protein
MEIDNLFQDDDMDPGSEEGFLNHFLPSKTVTLPEAIPGMVPMALLSIDMRQLRGGHLLSSSSSKWPAAFNDRPCPDFE